MIYAKSAIITLERRAKQVADTESIPPPWQGDPRANIQSDKGKAKAYQVRQVLKAINRLEAQK